jgi:hypothetical protein
MSDSESSCRITRVVDGDHHDVQLAQLQVVMQRIQTALCNVPASERVYLGNALLNLAVQKILCAEGSERTVNILMRMSDAVNAQASPHSTSSAIEVGALHG